MTSTRSESGPVSVALVNDYEIVVERLRLALEPYSDRVVVVDTEVGTDDVLPADVALFDTTGGHRHALARAQDLAQRGAVKHVVIYTTEASPGLIAAAHRLGVSDILPRRTAGEALVTALETIAAGGHPPEGFGRDAPGAAAGASATDDLTSQESDLLALVGMGLSNEQIADEMFTSVPRLRRQLQRLYRMLGVAGRAAAGDHARALGLTPRRGRPTDYLLGARMARRFRRVPADIPAARAFVRNAFADRGAPPDVVQAFVLVVSELAANVVAHGASESWTVGVKATSERFVLDVAGGTASADSFIFHPEHWSIADPGEPSGRGLGIVREVMDDVAVDTWHGQVRVRCTVRQR